MPSWIATFVYTCGILGLFFLDRDRTVRTSKALWIPVIWLAIASSRMVSQWLQVATPTDRPDQYLDGSPLDRFILTSLLIIGIGILLGRRQQVCAQLKSNPVLVLFVVYCAFSIFWSNFPAVAAKRWTKLVADVVMVLIVVTEADVKAAISRWLSECAFLLVPLSVLLIKYYPDLGRAYTRWTWMPVYTGVTTNKNLLGMICLVLGLASVWRILQSRGNLDRRYVSRSRIAHGVIVLMVLWLFAQANSMTSLSCFVLASGLLVITTVFRSARKPARLHLLCALLALAAFSALFLNIGSDIVENLGRDSTLTGRTELWSHVLQMHGNAFLGTGFESFWLGPRLQRLWQIYWWHPNEAHNGYLEVFLNLGWLGVALLGALLISGYHKIIASFAVDPAIAQLRLAYFVVAITYNFTEAAFRIFNPVWMVLLVAITAVPSPVPAEAEDEADLAIAESDLPPGPDIVEEVA
jgi:O-antigen ligase